MRWVPWTLTLLAGHALAQTPRSGGGAAENAELLQQIQQIASERTTLQAENTKLKKELEDVRKDRDALKNGHDGNDRRALAADTTLAHVAAEREAKAKDLAQTNQRLKELRDKFDETTKTLHDMESTRESTRESLAMRRAEFDTCVKRNQALLDLNSEWVSLFERAQAPQRDARATLDTLVEGYPVNIAETPAPRPQ